MQVELVAHMPLNSISGIGRYMRELYAHLQDRVPVRVVTPIDPPLTRFLSTLHHFPLGLRDHQPDSIVHFTQIMGCSQMLWHPVRPAIASVHDLGVLVCPEDELLFNRFDRWVLDMQFAGLRRMNHFVVSSDYTSQGLQQLFGIPENRIHKVQLGVNMQHYRPIENAWERISQQYDLASIPDTADLLYVGSELPRKNLGRLLEAVAILKASGYSLRFIKVGGSGGERWRGQFLADVQRLGLEENVVVVGRVPEEALPLFYNIAHISICPSLLEGGFSWPIMEAMACGTAAIASTASHVPEHVQETVLIVEPRELDSIIEAIKRCLDDTSFRERLAKKGNQAIAAFTWEAGVEQMLRVYQEIWHEFEGTDAI